jgi:hypothetical protein
LVVYNNSTTQLTVQYGGEPGEVAGGLLTDAAPVTIASGDTIGFTAKIPIAEWTGSGTINVAQNDVEYAAVAGTWDANDSTTVYGPGGAIMGGALTTTRIKTVTFQTTIRATDEISLEYSENQSVWYPAANAVISNAAVQNMMSAAGSLSGGSGAYIDSSGATSVRVYFARYQNIANDDAPAVDWPSTSYWRVKKKAAGAAVGFGEVTQTHSGLVKNAGQLLGTNTNDSAATGYVGEYLENVRSSALSVETSSGGVFTGSVDVNATFGTNTTTGETGITLTAGDWDIGGVVRFELGGGAPDTLSSASAWIGTAIGTSTTGRDLNRNTNQLAATFAASNDISLVLPTFRVSITATTTYYLKAIASFTHGTGTVQLFGSIRARRMR